MKRPLKAYAVMDPGGWFLAGPSNSKSAVVKEYAQRWDDTPKVTTFVPADPAREAVVRAATKHYVSHGSRTHSNNCDVCAAVEKLQKERKR